MQAVKNREVEKELGREKCRLLVIGCPIEHEGLVYKLDPKDGEVNRVGYLEEHVKELGEKAETILEGLDRGDTEAPESYNGDGYRLLDESLRLEKSETGVSVYVIPSQREGEEETVLRISDGSIEEYRPSVDCDLNWEGYLEDIYSDIN